MYTIETQAYQAFMDGYRSIRNNPQRLGQAFVDHFKLDKSVAMKPLVDKLYQLDGFNAIAMITQNFHLS